MATISAGRGSRKVTKGRSYSHRNDSKRKEEAKERLAYRKTLSAIQQLARLDERLGKNIGAAKERLRLNFKVTDVSVSR